MVFKALTSVFFLSLSLFSSKRRRGGAPVPDRDRARRSSDTRAPVEDRFGREIKRVSRQIDHARRSRRNVCRRAETLGRRAREEEVFLSRVSARFYGERKRPRRSREEWEESDKGEIDDGLDASGKRREIRADSE